MTTDQVPAAAAPAPFRPRGGGHPLAAAITVFLGGYLLLLSVSGPLTTVASAIVSGGERAATLPAGYSAQIVAQFLFAIVVVVGGLLLARRPDVVTVIAILLVTVAPVLFVLFQGARFSGGVRLPLGPELNLVVFSVLGNPWFHVVLVVGVGWLLCRPARLGWLSLLGTIVLVPVPQALTVAGAESGVVGLVMFALCALVGAGVVAGGKPWYREP